MPQQADECLSHFFWIPLKSVQNSSGCFGMCEFRSFNNGDSLTCQTPIGKDRLTDINKQHFSPLKTKFRKLCSGLCSAALVSLCLSGSVKGNYGVSGALWCLCSQGLTSFQSEPKLYFTPACPILPSAEVSSFSLQNTRPNGYHCLNRMEVTIHLAWYGVKYFFCVSFIYDNYGTMLTIHCFCRAEGFFEMLTEWKNG